MKRLAGAGAVLLYVLLAFLPARTAPGEAPADAWARLPAILARIRPPTFPARAFPITRYGAKAGGVKDCTEAFRRAIAACNRAGGGRVVVPPGVYLTGPVHLLGNVNLHVSAGATVLFSTDPAAYMPVVLTRWEGVELMNYSPLVYAYGQENVAITGEGTLDGQAGPERWWDWKPRQGAQPQKPDRDRLFGQAEEGVPVAQRIYGSGHYLRPSFIQPYRCRNVLVEGVTIRNSPMWVVHPVLSQNVTVRRVTVVSPGPNNDGCNPESSSDVLIEDSTFDTGDDCIAIKSGRNADGRRIGVASERIVVRGCRMRAGHGGVTIGSEVSGGVRDVFAERCQMSSPRLERGLRIKTNAMRGGVVEGVYARDVDIGEVGSAIDIDLLYEEGEDGPFTPVVRDVRVERMVVQRARYALFVRGMARSPVRGLSVADSVFRGVERGSLVVGLADLQLRNVSLEPARR
jgi:polygalacturonase